MILRFLLYSTSLNSYLLFVRLFEEKVLCNAIEFTLRRHGLLYAGRY